MKSNYKRLGDYIEPCDEKNSNGEALELRGISNQKFFQKAKTNTIGVDLTKYRIVRTGQFAFNRATTRNGDKISIALSQEADCIVSPSYRIFKSKDENVLNSEYLMMWFRRPEFDRYARFKSHGSAHEFFDYGEMCEVDLPIPSIEKQREIVREYNTIVNRISLNERLNQKLEETAQAIYKQWFVDFEFPNEDGKPYKSAGGKMVWCEELDKEIPEGWVVKTLDKFCECLDSKRKPLSGEERSHIKGVYPYYGAMSIVDYIDSYIYDGIFLLISEDGANVVDINGRPATQYVWGKFWLNNHAHIIKGKEPFSTEFLRLALSFVNASHLVTGAAQPKINQQNLMSIELICPDKLTLQKADSQIKQLFQKIINSKEQIVYLEKTIDLLLSKMTKVEETTEKEMI